MQNILLTIKDRLYIFVAVDIIVALFFGIYFNFRQFNIRLISFAAVFMMLYPILTGMAVVSTCGHHVWRHDSLCACLQAHVASIVHHVFDLRHGTMHQTIS